MKEKILNELKRLTYEESKKVLKNVENEALHYLLSIMDIFDKQVRE